MSGDSLSQQLSHEVHFQEPRHPCENPLLLVSCEKYPEEWYFEVSSRGDRLFATADCRLDFRADGEEPADLGAVSWVPRDIQDAVLEYDGPYAVDQVRNPAKERDEL